jgi:hypothetical protein
MFSDFRKERFELLTNSGEVSVDGVWFDMERHVDSKKGQSVGGRFNREVV